MRFVNSPLIVESYLRGQLNKLSQYRVWLLSRGLGGLEKGSGDTVRREISIKDSDSYCTLPLGPGACRSDTKPYHRAWKDYPTCALVQGTKAPKKAVDTQDHMPVK